METARDGAIASGDRMGRWLVLTWVGLVAACESAGPGFIQRDQVNYSAALLEAEKQQLLVNIVRLRYGDIPSVVRVDQIVAGYERRILGSIGSTVANDFDFTDDFAVRAEGSIADRPTYTIRPLQGADYARFMLRPVPPRELVGLIASGANLFSALGLAVARINGIPNNELLTGPEPSTGRFWRVLWLMQTLRNDGLLQIEFEPDPENQTERVFLSFVRLADEPRNARATELIDLLRLDPSRPRYEVVLGVAARNRGEIAIWTRSQIEILSDIGAGIQAGEDEPRQPRLVGAARERPSTILRINVTGGVVPPGDTFAQARYADRWYWIESTDAWSKRAFSMLLLTTILERDDRSAGAILTIPAN